MTEHYTIDRVVKIIKYYNDNLRYTQTILEDALQSVGVAQYGIESVMPKASGTSNPVEKQVIRSIKANQTVADKLTDMKYIQDRLYRIDDERDAIIIYSMMSGKNQQEVATMLDISRQSVNDRLKNIARTLKGELSTVETDKTDKVTI